MKNLLDSCLLENDCGLIASLAELANLTQSVVEARLHFGHGVLLLGVEKRQPLACDRQLAALALH